MVKGIHNVEQIWHSTTTEMAVKEEQCHALGANCHTGVFFRTIKSLVHALGVNPQMTESTINSTLYIFIEQVNSSNLQKMVLLFTIQFASSMVYALYNKVKHLIHQFSTHSKQSSCIPS